MMEFLDFTFRSFWHFAGVLFLICAVLNGLAGIAAAIRSGKT